MQLYCPARKEVWETPAQPLAAGGEGEVFPIVAHPGLLAKIFKKPAADNRREKIETLVAHPFQHDPPEPDGFRRFAMPQDILVDRATDQFIGYVMPRIKGEALDEYFDPGSTRYRRDPTFRVRLAIAVAELVADTNRHILMLVLGDLNPRNILADDLARAALIDLDSAQLTTIDGTTYHCTVCTDYYKSPELYRKDLHTLKREQSSDLFALATLIFQLLSERGHHPFAAANDPDLIARIRRGDFPYVPGSAHPPPPGAKPLSAFPADIQHLLLQSFVDSRWDPGARPTADLWAEALRRNAKALVRPKAVAPAPVVTTAPAAGPPSRGNRRAVLAAVAVAVLTAVAPGLLPAGWRFGRAGVATLAGPTPTVQAGAALRHPSSPPIDALPRGPVRGTETPAYWRRLRDGEGEPLSFECPDAERKP